MKIVYKRLRNNKNLFFNRKLQRHYNFYCYTDNKQSTDPKGVKIFAKRLGGRIIKGNQSANPLRKPLY